MVTFSEVQRFRQRWLWILLGASTLAVLAVFGHGLIEQLAFGRPWGNRPVADGTLILISILALLFMAGMLSLFAILQLITVVDGSGIHLRFRPFRMRLIAFGEIAECASRRYRPLAEYGGWGLKYGRRGWAWNISGDQGVQLVLKSGQRLLIGSQRADELAAAVRQGMQTLSSPRSPE